MAIGSTLYTFEIDLSDVDRGVYDTVEMRLAQHRSESVPFLLTRVFAALLNHQDGLNFSAGLGDPDEPPLSVTGPTGVLELWIDIGNPAPARIHKASKAARALRIYTYKEPELLRQSVAGERIHDAEAIEVFSLPPEFMAELEAELDRRNRWTVVHTEGALYVTCGERTHHGALGQHRLVD